MNPDQTFAPMPFVDDGPMWAADLDSEQPLPEGLPPAVPLPAGATEVGDWRLETGTGREFRYFEGTRRASGCEPDGRAVEVRITGSQRRDGTIERYVTDGNICLDAAAARAHAGDELAAADELDRLEQ